MPSLLFYDSHNGRRNVRQVPRNEEGGATMKFSANHKTREINMWMGFDESQMVWDMLCQEELPHQAKLCVVMTGNCISIRRAPVKEKKKEARQ